MSYQRPITHQSVILGNFLAHSTLYFTGCSHYQIRRYRNQSNWHVVYNGFSLEQYDFQEKISHDAPLVYLGRVEEFKGVHIAIEVALRANRKLIIAGNVPEKEDAQQYYQKKIKQHIDGEKVVYIGAVNDQKKNKLLGCALALLFPLLGDEAFGIVMAEAFACGTPVIGFHRGPIPEVIQQGVNGFVCHTTEEMIEAARKVGRLDRKICRHIAEEKFSNTVLVKQYEELYQKMLNA